jgi:DtxR family transcriptional regulator, Mn-dependent transcriptional regulator
LGERGPFGKLAFALLVDMRGRAVIKLTTLKFLAFPRRLIVSGEATAVTANIEEYLEQIYRLSKENDEVTTTDLARNMKVSPASVTGMLKRLSERGLIHYQPYHGITLTDEGRAVAMKIIRRHGLLERFLTEILELPWHMADVEAGRLEHYITPEVEERLDILLKHPKTCPHGQPLDMEQPDYTVRLSTLQPRERARVSRIGVEEPDFLAYVDELGLRPEVEVIVTGRAPFNGPLMVAVGEREHALGDEVTRHIWVDKLEPADAN